jgi:hypothetical protein
LVRYDAACRALAEAKSVDEVKDLRDKSEAMRVYAMQAKNKQLEVDAAEIRIRAERRLGEMIALQKKTVGLNQGAKGSSVTGSIKTPVKDDRPTLAEAGVDKKLSARAQKMAAIPEDEFEQIVSDWRGRVEQENERVSVNLLRAGEKHSARQGEADARTDAEREADAIQLVWDRASEQGRALFLSANNLGKESHEAGNATQGVVASPVKLADGVSGAPEANSGKNYPSGGGAFAAVKSKARLANASGVEPSPSVPNPQPTSSPEADKAASAPPQVGAATHRDPLDPGPMPAFLRRTREVDA